MAEYTYPVVFVVEVENRPQPIAGVPTSISAALSREAIAAIGGLIDRLPPEWTDDNQHDPGIALVELAAWLGESVLYRHGGAPEPARRAAARLAAASLTVLADRRMPDGPINRARYYSGVLLDGGDPLADADGGICLKIGRKDRSDPLAPCDFRLSVAGVAVAGFGEVEGLSGSRSPRLFEPLLRRLRRLLGIRKVANITLKRGIVSDRGLADWYRNSGGGTTDRRDVMVRQIRPQTDFRLVNAWITRIEGPALNGSANDVAIESLELACEAICVQRRAETGNALPLYRRRSRGCDP